MPGDINKITPSDVEEFGLKLAGGNAMDEYQRIATKTAIYPGHKTPLGLNYVSLKLNGEAGELAEHVGKAMRDDGLIQTYTRWCDNTEITQVEFMPLTEDRKDKIIKEVGDVMWYISAICNELGISLSQACLQNLQKLQSRSERGKLTGSGDNR